MSNNNTVSQKRLLIFSGISGALAVSLGAMGAHYLDKKAELGFITLKGLAAFKTAAQYHLIHTIVVFALALFITSNSSKYFKWSANCFIAGIILFSGSLYILSLSPLFTSLSLKWLGPVTPLGGLFFITGWIFIVVAAFREKKIFNI